jgi:hypothetical protein
MTLKTLPDLVTQSIHNVIGPVELFACIINVPSNHNIIIAITMESAFPNSAKNYKRRRLLI